MIYERFYAELGKLIYAAAYIDGVITDKEKNILQNIIKNELVPSEKHVDKYGTNTAYYPEIELDFLGENTIDTESAFNSFIDFVEDHHTAFDANMKKISLHVVEEIFNSYKGVNKKEKELLEKLKAKLEKIETKG